MVGGYYLNRWELFLHELSDSLGSNKSFDEKEFQSRLRRWMADWSDQRDVYPTQPQGDSIQVAKMLWAKYVGWVLNPRVKDVAVGVPRGLRTHPTD